MSPLHYGGRVSIASADVRVGGPVFVDVLKDNRVANLSWLDIQATQFVLPGMVQWLVRRDEPTTWTNRRLTYPTCRKPFLDSDTTGSSAN